MKGIYRFKWDCERSGELEGVFVADDWAVADLAGKDVYFGEVLGKHSDIYGAIEGGDIVLLTDNQEFIDIFEEKIGAVGYNPLDYIEDDDEN